MMRNLCYFRSNDMMQWIKISLSFVSFSKIESSSSRDELCLPLYPWIFFFILCRQVEYTFIDQNILLLLYNREHRGIHSQCQAATQPISTQYILGQNRQALSRRNASKFAIYYIYQNPKLLFPFFISCYYIFSLVQSTQTRVFIREKIQQHEMEKGNFGFSYI